MSGKTAIGWTNATWNPVVGCTRVTAGCDHCYAAALHNRRHQAMLAGATLPAQYRQPFETIQLLPERLDWPLHQKQPKMIFVNSVSDLLHSAVPDDYIRQVFAVMRCASWHTFQVLTKRAGRLRTLGPTLDWPENVWMGVSIEEDRLSPRADALRIGARKAAVRFISAEPLLGPLPSLNLKDIDWLIAGSESGHGARPMQDAWVRDLRDRCVQRGTAFFFKQRSDASGHKQVHPVLDGRSWEQFPATRELVDYGAFAAQHGITLPWQNFALYSGFVHLAPWREDAGRMINDLGRLEFWHAFHTRPEFISCVACPHPTIVETPFSRPASPPESAHQPGSLWDSMEVTG